MLNSIEKVLKCIEYSHYLIDQLTVSTTTQFSVTPG